MSRKVKDLRGKTAVITGVTTGIGYELGKVFALRGARVILGFKDLGEALLARDTLMQETGNLLIAVKDIDFGSFESVRNFANDVLDNENRIDILVNIIGFASHGSRRTEDGLQLELQINHYGPFLLTNLLLRRIRETAPSRIIMVSTMGHKFAKINLEDFNMERNWNGTNMYYNSNLCNIITTNELARRLEGTGVTANSIHPGVVMTEIFRNLPGWFRIPLHGIIKAFYKTASEAAQTVMYVAVSPDVRNISGEYFIGCKPSPMSGKTKDYEFARTIWKLSEHFVKLDRSERHYYY